MADDILTVKDISIAFGGIKAVSHISFSLKSGEIVGLIGPNGSGKSTCVNLISGVYQLDGGEVLFGGKSLTRAHTADDRAKMGMGRTFQSPKPFGNLTVFDNIFTIALQTRNHTHAAEKTREILARTKLEPLQTFNSLKLPIEKRKWLDLARILANDPQLIMMDEVMAGLNPSEMDESLQLIEEINRGGVTVLFIEHVMKAVVRVCSRVVVLNEGKFLCEGDPNDILCRREVIEAYLGGGYVHA
jgi:ABC-type branched-subunit amino acid transport system ATPase component